MLGILLLTQANLAQEFKLISMRLFGEIGGIEAVSYCPYSVNFSELKDKVEHLIEDLGKSMGVVILTDCLGSLGTRVAVAAAENKKNVEIISGINLAMLLNLIIHRKDSLDVASECAKKAAQQNILRLTKYFYPAPKTTPQKF